MKCLKIVINMSKNTDFFTSFANHRNFWVKIGCQIGCRCNEPQQCFTHGLFIQASNNAIIYHLVIILGTGGRNGMEILWRQQTEWIIISYVDINCLSFEKEMFWEWDVSRKSPEAISFLPMNSDIWALNSFNKIFKTVWSGPFQLSIHLKQSVLWGDWPQPFLKHYALRLH